MFIGAVSYINLKKVVVLFCNSGKIIKSFITIEREYKEELGVPSCGVSYYYYLATKSHWWELCVLCPQEPAWKKCLKIISWINKCKKGIGMKCKFALESYTGHHFDKTSDVLSIVGLETFKNGVVGDIVACMLSHFSSFQLFATHRAPLSIGFSKQEYWSGLSYPPPGYLPDEGIEPKSPKVSCIDRWVLYY